MNQCVPSWDLDDPAAVIAGGGLNNHPVHAAGGGAYRGAAVPAGTRTGASAFAPVVVPMSYQYYEVAELTWQKGNISSHGLLNRPPPSKQYAPAAAPSQSQQLHGIVGGGGGTVAAGDRETLEAVVGEAAARSHFLLSQHPQPPVQHPAAPWLGVARSGADALVPCAVAARVAAGDEAAAERGDGSAADDASRRKRARVVVGEDGLVCASQGSAAPGRRGESALLTLDGCCGTAGADDLCGFTATTNNSTSLDRDDDKGSPDTENTSIGGGASDSRCFSRRSQRDGLCDEAENVVIKGDGAVRSSISTKRSRAAAIHNESERKRRDRINQKMKTLQKLVPNSSKTDKASMLDEVIDYLKQLQAQVQVMSRMSSMMMPMAMPQLQMSVMAQMAHMAQMAQMAQGMMNMGSLAQPSYAGLTPPMMPPFVPAAAMSWDPTAAAAAASNAGAGVVGTTDRAPQPAGGIAGSVPDAFSAFLACQAQQNGQQPGGMEAYNKMVALYQKMSQQQQQQQQGQPSNSSKQ
ncbi:unnamed protein product [Urochloa decumbens]|uniref:BHLH domain-containing protein n=1 Tax=Urochloa decumbens TaxID=240449 RepID=A0ABC8YDV1_9POAL